MDSRITCIHSLFNGLKPDEVEKITQNLESINISEGGVIITEHEKGDNLYLICDGKVEINKGVNEEEHLIAQLNILEKGDIFGEMSIVDEAPRSASARAVSDVHLLKIPKDRFIEMAFSQPIVMFNLIRTLSSRLRDANTKFVELMNSMISKNRLMAIGMAASKIIHDIKTPLTVIVLTAQLVENLYPDSHDFTESIIKQTRLIDQMVREILDYAKGNQTMPVIQKINLHLFLNEIQDTYGHALQGRNIKFVINNNVTQEVYFDEGKIRRVVLNLLKNSSEAIVDGGQIEVTAKLATGWLQITIADDGCGISENIQENLFKPFVSDGKPHGTGLGLAICQKLVEEHQGILEFQPNTPKGSKFIIRIPQQDK